nr:FK506-binding protein 15-like isoform X2 [Ciona intestinalis]|eukprot:XP_009859642.1 FK506-binding protein 15-like isoform X2 [Ciona intestinalis]
MSYFSLGGQNDDDGEFLNPAASASLTGGSKLSSLFGMNDQMTKNPNSNQSLTYTAPKPPGKQQEKPQNKKKQTSAANTSGVAYAVAVTAYKYVNSQHVKQGKLGAAILKNLASNDFKILMYVTKQQPVCTAQINRNFNFVVQANNYASFYDDQRQSWNVMFDSSEQIVEFAKQICLAKYFGNPTPCDSVVVQDITPHDAKLNHVEMGDSLEVKYTRWLVNEDGTLGAVFDSNEGKDKTFRFKTDKGKVIQGWEQGMMGMQKGGTRYLIIPPHLAYGEKRVGNKVPPNSTLAFKVNLLRMKQSRDNSSMKSAGSVDSVPQEVSAEQAVEIPKKVTHETTVKERTSSLNDQLSHVGNDDGKSNLMMRMAKMGQALIPNPTANQAEVESHPQPHVVNPTPQSTPAPAIHINNDIETHPQLVVHRASPKPAQHNVMQPVQPPYQPIQQPYIPPAVSHPSSIHHSHESPYHSYHPGYQPMQPYPPMQQSYGELPILLSESRQHLTELRLLQEKVDKVSNLVQEVKEKSVDPMKSNLSASQTMDAALIMHNIQRIMQENDHIKQQVLEKNKIIENQNDKISNLLQQGQKHAEQNNLLLEQRNDSFKESFGQSQARLLQLEQDKVDLTEKLSEATSKVSQLMLEATNAKQRDSDIRQKFKEVYSAEKEKCEELSEKVQELEEEISTLRVKVSTSDQQDSTLNKEITKLKQELQESKSKYEKSNALLMKKSAEWEEERKSILKRIEENKMSYEEKLSEVTSQNDAEHKSKAELQLQIESLKEKLNQESPELQESNSKLETLQQKFLQLRGLYEERGRKITEVEEELEEATPYKEAYDKLRQQATMMKQKYDANIQDLRQKLEDTDVPTTSGEDFVQQVKEIMNSIFHQIKSEVTMEEEYSGKEVLSLVLGVIKATTFEMLSKNKEGSEDEQSDSSEEEESEEENEGEDEVHDDVVRDNDVRDNKDVEEEVGSRDANHNEDEKSNVHKEYDSDPQKYDNPVKDDNDHVEVDHKEDDSNHVKNDVHEDDNADIVHEHHDHKKDDKLREADACMKVDDHHSKNGSEREDDHVIAADDIADHMNDDDHVKERVDSHEKSSIETVNDPIVDTNVCVTENLSSEIPNDPNTVEENGKTVEETKDIPPSDRQVGEALSLEKNLNEAILAKIEEKLDSVGEVGDRSRTSSHDDGREPPPLFDDEEEDDDLDWLN